MDDENRREVLIEAMMNELKIIREGVEALSGVPSRLDRIDHRLENLESDMQVVKIVLREHSADVTELKDKSHIHSN